MLFQSVLQRERVDDRAQHAHVIAGDAFDAAFAALKAAEDVAAADDDDDFDAELADFADLPRHFVNGFRAYPQSAFAAEGFAAKLEENTTVLGRFVFHSGLREIPGRAGLM